MQKENANILLLRGFEVVRRWKLDATVPDDCFTPICKSVAWVFNYFTENNFHRLFCQSSVRILENLLACFQFRPIQKRSRRKPNVSVSKNSPPQFSENFAESSRKMCSVFRKKQKQEQVSQFALSIRALSGIATQICNLQLFLTAMRK